MSVQLGTIAINETPLFAELSMGRDELLFEDWQPSDAESFVREYFPPYAPEDEIEQSESTKAGDSDEVESDSVSETTAEFQPFLVRPLQNLKAS